MPDLTKGYMAYRAGDNGNFRVWTHNHEPVGQFEEVDLPTLENYKACCVMLQIPFIFCGTEDDTAEEGDVLAPGDPVILD